MKYRHVIQPNAAIRAMMDGKQKARDMWELADNQVRRCINAWGEMPRDLRDEATRIIEEESVARRCGIPQNIVNN